MKNHLLIVIFGTMLLLAACTTANADTDLNWRHNNNEGQANNHIAEEVNNLKHTPQEAVDKINSLYEGTVVEVDLDGDDGVYYYEIEIVNGKIKYESKVNANNLEIIKLEKGGSDSEEALNGVKRITPEAALDIADDELGGEVISWELENDEYEILMEVDDKSFKIEIDALTADVLNSKTQDNERDKIDGSGGKGKEAAKDKADDGKEERSSDKGKSKPAEKEKAQKESENQQENQQVKEEKSQPQQEEQPKKEEQESENKVDRQISRQPDYSDGILTPQAAMNIALDAVGGIVIEWEYDDDDFEYEIELVVNGQEVEVEVDSRNGTILDIDYDD